MLKVEKFLLIVVHVAGNWWLVQTFWTDCKICWDLQKVNRIWYHLSVQSTHSSSLC